MKRAFGCAVLIALLGGCYTLQPSGGVVPELGKAIAMDINDAGRLAIGSSMGQEIAQIEGRLMGKESGEYTVAVSMVHLLRGGEQVWRGERVKIKPEHVAYMYERKFDRGRSIAMGTIGVGAAVVMLTRGLRGEGEGDRPKLPGDTANSVRRRP